MTYSRLHPFQTPKKRKELSLRFSPITMDRSKMPHKEISQGDQLHEEVPLPLHKINSSSPLRVEAGFADQNRPELAETREERGQVSSQGDQTVINNQVEAAELLLRGNSEFVAAAKRQFQMLELFLTKTQVADVNVANDSNFTTLDMLSLGRPSECQDMEIHNKLVKSNERKRNPKPKKKLHDTGSSNALSWMPGSWFQMQQKDKDWFKEKHNTLLIVATLIATVTFAAGLSPPGGIWQEPNSSPSSPNRPGKAIQNNYDPKTFKFFMYFDMSGLVSSLFIILFLVSGLPLKNPLTTWILVINMWVAVTSMTMAFVYGTKLVVVSDRISQKLFWVLVSWSGLMGILLFWHLIVFLFHLIHMCVMGIPIWSWMNLRRKEKVCGESDSLDDRRQREPDMAGQQV